MLEQCESDINNQETLKRQDSLVNEHDDENQVICLTTIVIHFLWNIFFTLEII